MSLAVITADLIVQTLMMITLMICHYGKIDHPDSDSDDNNIDDMSSAAIIADLIIQTLIMITLMICH